VLHSMQNKVVVVLHPYIIIIQNNSPDCAVWIRSVSMRFQRYHYADYLRIQSSWISHCVCASRYLCSCALEEPSPAFHSYM
jgi:hypothetical protein